MLGRGVHKERHLNLRCQLLSKNLRALNRQSLT